MQHRVTLLVLQTGAFSVACVDDMTRPIVGEVARFLHIRRKTFRRMLHI
jgi:hypothetical protein